MAIAQVVAYHEKRIAHHLLASYVEHYLPGVRNPSVDPSSGAIRIISLQS